MTQGLSSSRGRLAKTARASGPSGTIRPPVLLSESAIADAPKIVAGLRAGKAYAAVPVPSQPVIRKGRNGSFHDKG